MISVNARLFAAAALFTSAEHYRYYLHAVRIEPMASGALLVATDGHRLICIHDAAAECAEPVNVVVPEAIIALCPNYTLCTCGDASGIPALYDEAVSEPVVRGDADCRIAVEDKYPDWRRVLSTLPSEDADAPLLPAALFNGEYLGSYGAAAKLIIRRHSTGAIKIISNAAKLPALIRIADCAFAFGVLMPVMSQVPPLAMPDLLPAKVSS